MRLIFTSYAGVPEFNQPLEWLQRIDGYTGILESLAADHSVTGVERINHEGWLEKNGVRYYFIRQLKRKKFFPFRMHRQILKMKPDVVFVNGLIFPLQVIQLGWMMGKRKKIILLHRAERPFRGIRRFLQEQADRFVHAYLFTSREFGREWLEKGIIRDEQKIHEVIQASSRFQPADTIAARKFTGVEGEQVFLWVGRLDENKDPLTVVQAFMEYAGHQPGARLYMIFAEAPLKKDILQLINSEKQSGEAIRLVGKIPHDQLEHWYNSADFFISGSHYEGSGVALSEAMSCGCIPIVTGIASFRKMTGPGRCGFLYKPGSREELLSLLRNTIHLNMDEERKNVLEQFRKELSFEAIARKINTILQT